MRELEQESSEAERALERLLDRTLRELPLRRSPPTLESRVLIALQGRNARPWWRRSFGYWPGGARAAFAFVCAVLVGLAVFGGGWAVEALTAMHDSGALSMSWVQRMAAVVGAVREISASLVRTVPADWIDGGLAFSALLYTALFGLGIAAYRMLYMNLKPVSGAA